MHKNLLKHIIPWEIITQIRTYLSNKRRPNRHLAATTNPVKTRIPDPYLPDVLVFIPTQKCVSFRSCRGFSLIEMAMLLAVAGTLMLGAISAMKTQARKTQIEKTRQSMREIEQALLGFIAVKGRLPCPDWYDGNVADGKEDRDDATKLCLRSPNDQQFGLLPWQSLGVKPMDQWENFYSYRVTANAGASFFTKEKDDGADRYTANSSGDMIVKAEDDNTLADGIPVIVISHGPNGKGAYRMLLNDRLKNSFIGNLEIEKNATNKELYNIIDDDVDGDNTVKNDNPTTFYHAGDDILMWIPANVIKHRAIEHGWLP